MTASIADIEVGGIKIGDWVRYQGITREVSAVIPGAEYIDLSDSEGNHVDTVHVADVVLVNTITVTYQACPGCGEAIGECSCHPMIIGIAY